MSYIDGEYVDTRTEDEKVIGYCRLHCTTERALFGGRHVNKMLELAGFPEEYPRSIDPNSFVTMRGDMERLCDLAEAIARKNKITNAVASTIENSDSNVISLNEVRKRLKG